MSKRFKRRRPNLAPNDYGLLEPRQMLAATGLPQFDGDTSVEQTLVGNGTFEALDVEVHKNNLVAPDTVDYWDVFAPDSGTQINLLRFPDSPRGTVLELDSTADDFDHVMQTISTESNQLYTFAFDLRGRPVDAGAHESTNEVEVFWNGENVGSYRGIDFWQTIALQVESGGGTQTRLEFREIAGAGNDGRGPLIDNVRVIKVNATEIENGGFESAVNTDSGTIVDAEDVPGWNTFGDAGDQKIDLRTGNASEGDQYVNLDTS